MTFPLIVKFDYLKLNIILDDAIGNLRSVERGDSTPYTGRNASFVDEE